jgi:hypothetical protein
MHLRLWKIVVAVGGLSLVTGCTQPSQRAQMPAKLAAATAPQGQTQTSIDDFHAAMGDMRSGNYTEAMRLFRRIDAGQDIPAQANRLTYQQTLCDTRSFIGEMYEKGWGVPQDYKAARYWYQKSIDTGGDIFFPSARMANLYEQGLGGPRDHQKYLELSPLESAKTAAKAHEEEERRKWEALMAAMAAANRSAPPLQGSSRQEPSPGYCAQAFQSRSMFWGLSNCGQ